jgi:outer membrane protein assembly factor BamB
MSNEPSVSPSVRNLLIGGGLLIALVLAFPLARDTYRRSADDQHHAALAEDRTLDGAVSVTAPNDPATWTTFRGPMTAGTSTETGLLNAWPVDGPPEVFRRPIGGGHAGFVVTKGRAFTLEQRLEEEVVVAYDLVTGKQLWEFAYAARFSESMGGDGPRSTPTLDGDTLYSLGATGVLLAIDATTGTQRWRHNVLEELEAPNLQWALSASPLVLGDRVIVASSGIDSAGFVAYHTETGEELWTSDWLLQGYATPIAVTLAGQEQILHLAGEALVGIDPDTGDQLWSHPWATFKGIAASQPLLLGDDQIFVSTGYGAGSCMVKVTKTGDTWSTEQVWRTEFMANQFNSSVLVDGVVYGLHDGVLAAQDAATGAPLWEGERYGHGQLMYADGKLIVLADNGTLVLLPATRERPEEISRVAALNGRTWAVPTLAGGRLLVRNEREMVAYDLRAN